MPNLQAIKKASKTIKGISKITNSMYLISASKVKKSVSRFKTSQQFYQELSKLLSKVGKEGLESVPLSKPKYTNKITLLVIGPMKGFVGPIIQESAKKIRLFVKEFSNYEIEIVSVNKLGLKICQRSGLNPKLHFQENLETETFFKLIPVIKYIRDEYINGDSSQIWMLYQQYVNQNSTASTLEQILPILPTNIDFNSIPTILEPDVTEVANHLTNEYLERNIFLGALSSQASENSVRMLTMKNATDNAIDMHQTMQKKYNKLRQALVTQQILELQEL